MVTLRQLRPDWNVVETQINRIALVGSLYIELLLTTGLKQQTC
jgi:hypothetical protein